ncbi:hypothetical protein P154DRAFT_569080 [Amniculicola lignicola CBS 123094]|uniref:Uncharacterized protein n=1 Tax=Amniculicola lignicola CBS 123094 TaxID=1392246 RepID=A0A6A5X157_9PLEO|nr:hypothetical protein P154DRAFT_569080 [Amniculicola lignicola CBS 123094]
MVLNHAWEAITGLIVNTKTGGVGFRNHTTPPVLPYGSTWSEDVLFIEPETECVDLNITLDFNILYSDNTFEVVQNITITDHGGFANLVRDIPWYGTNETYTQPNLRDCAYFAGWFSNVYSVFYLNVTNSKNEDFAIRFQYLNSRVGARYPIDPKFGSFKVRYDRLMLQGVYGSYLARQEHFFLPRLAFQMSPSPTHSMENLAGVDFCQNVMNVAYQQDEIDSTVLHGLPDYAGQTNLALFNKWQALSPSASQAANIINLIWMLWSEPKAK